MSTAHATRAVPLIQEERQPHQHDFPLYVRFPMFSLPGNAVSDLLMLFVENYFVGTTFLE